MVLGRPVPDSAGGLLVAKKKKKKGKKGDGGSALGSAGAAAAKATNSLKAMSQNPLVADVVAAALVATAAAIKNSK
jgi:hypothetical protein